MRTLTRALATFTTAIAILIALHTILVPEGHPVWIIGKLAAATLVTGIGIVTWLHPWRPSVEPLLLLGGMALLVLGSAGAVWTLHLARVTGDLEAWGIAVNLSLVAQGGLITWHLWSAVRRQLGGCAISAI